MSGKPQPVLASRVWRTSDCTGKPLAERHRLADGQVVVSWTVDPETLRGPVWLEILEEQPGDPSAS